MKQIIGWGAVLILILVFAGIGRKPAPAPPAEASTASATLSDERQDAARDEAVDQLATQGFGDVGDTGLCTEDCSGHDAGFEWAKEQGVTDASECGGKSQSFIEGCEAYATTLEERSGEVAEEEGEENND